MYFGKTFFTIKKNILCHFRYSDLQNWCPFILIGKNVTINLKQIRHAMLDQTLDKTERIVEEQSGKELLNPKTVIPSGTSMSHVYIIKLFFIILNNLINTKQCHRMC